MTVWTDKAVAQMWGCRANAVRQWRRRHGMPILGYRGRREVWSSAQVAAATALRLAPLDAAGERRMIDPAHTPALATAQLRALGTIAPTVASWQWARRPWRRPVMRGAMRTTWVDDAPARVKVTE